MRVLGVIVNWRTPDLTVRALEALVPQLLRHDGRVIVVDNASGDDSIDVIERRIADKPWVDRVEILAAPKNGGYGYGNNLGFRRGFAASPPPDYFYVLNSDAFPDPGAVDALVEFLDCRDDVGIAGSYIHGTDGTPHGTAFRFPSPISEFESSVRLGVVTRLFENWVVPMALPEEASAVDWIAGASMLIRREVLEEIGLFDETFFLYFEETDLCRRARDGGWPTYFVPESSVAHVGSASTGMTDIDRRRPTYWFDSRRHYFRKSLGEDRVWIANTAYVAGATLWKLRRLIERKPRLDSPNMYRDFLRHTLLSR